jgi:hypothetical protein
MGTVIPTIVGLITARESSEIVQTVVGAVVSIIVGLVSFWSFTGQFNWVQAGIAVMFTFISTEVASRSIYKPSGATKKLQTLTPINIGSTL